MRVLGPIDLLTPEGVVPIGSRHLRALLGAMVISAGHAVPADRLEQAIWGERLPPSVDSSLHSYVSRLRRLLGPDSVVVEDHAYRLEARPEQIDALQFEHLLLRAAELRSEPPRCLALCRDALGLWRGQPFGELGDELPFRLEALRLDELRVATMELSLETELALGRHEFAVAELESLVEEYPYREQLWQLLVTALLRAGRRIEAMRQSARLQEVLAAAGLETSRAMRDLEAEILGGEPPADPRN